MNFPGNFKLDNQAFMLNFDFPWQAVYVIPLLVFSHLIDVVVVALVLIRFTYFTLSNSGFQFVAGELEAQFSDSKRVKKNRSFLT